MRRFIDSLLGRTRTEPPKGERLFAMATAHVTLQTSLGLEPDRMAGITFRPVSSGYFEQAAEELNQLLEISTQQSSATFRTTTDNFGFDWIILDDGDFEDMVATIHVVSTTLMEHQFGDRILAAVFRFKDRNGRSVYWFYNFRQGTYYPFIPTGKQQRDNAEEMRLANLMGRELPVEKELERWYPMWEIPF
ncbi:MAG: hypothetical protein EA415_03025 [Sphaerobacteraceae bacterium]|nr:MAG: hypothetical protein EA415_03025 [Sphaerobacteraceae bacterium]